VEGGEPLRVEELGGARVVFVVLAGSAPASPDLLAGLGEDLLIGGVLPLHELLNEAEEALAFGFLRFGGGELLGDAGGVVHHLGEDHRAGRGQGAAGPPQVKR
jgi:hypothetical protein